MQTWRLRALRSCARVCASCCPSPQNEWTLAWKQYSQRPSLSVPPPIQFAQRPPARAGRRRGSDAPKTTSCGVWPRAGHTTSADDCKENYTDKDLPCTVRNAALRVCPASGSREGATATRDGRVGHDDWVRPILRATQHARCRGLKSQGSAGARRAVAAAASGSAEAARCISVARGGSARADAATGGRKAPPPPRSLFEGSPFPVRKRSAPPATLSTWMPLLPPCLPTWGGGGRTSTSLWNGP